MSIGNAGKRAQAIGQNQKSRYQVNYEATERAPLLPPRSRSEKSVQRNLESEPNTIVDPPPLSQNKLQREADVDASAEAESVSEDTDNKTETPQIDAKIVADKVFKMMKRDMRIARERRGKSRF